MLFSLGCLSFSPPLENRIRKKFFIEPGHSWEIQLRGCSVWAVELLRSEIQKQAGEGAESGDESSKKPLILNAILLDYHLYDTAKALEAEGAEMIPHHRTRSIWY